MRAAILHPERNIFTTSIYCNSFFSVKDLEIVVGSLWLSSLIGRNIWLVGVPTHPYIIPQMYDSSCFVWLSRTLFSVSMLIFFQIYNRADIVDDFFSKAYIRLFNSEHSLRNHKCRTRVDSIIITFHSSSETHWNSIRKGIFTTKNNFPRKNNIL